MTKGYYFVKIPKKIFIRNDIVYLESLENGKEAVLVYFKLMVSSADTYGVISKSYRKIQGLIDVDLDSLKRTIPVLEQYGFLKSIDEEHYMVKDTNQDTVFISQEFTGRDRNTSEYKEWRKAVFERDKYTCQKCGARGCKLNAHHKMPWAKYIELRFDINNGITLCEKCHKIEHKNRRCNKNGRETNVRKNHN